MDKIRLVTYENRGDGETTEFKLFKNEENARACFEDMCKETREHYEGDYYIEERDDYLYVDDLYIYIEIFSSGFEDDE